MGSGPLAYQWQKDGEPLADGDGIAGSETAALILTGVAGEDRGAYALVTTNGLGSKTSQVAQVDVVDPVITSQPVTQTPPPGGTLTLSVEIAASDPLSYQWQRDGEVLVDDGRISGSQTAVLSVADSSSADDGLYRVTVSNAYGSVTSREIPVKVAVIMVDLEFNVAMESTDAVHSLAIQPDGRILVGGEFSTVNGQTRKNLARLLPDGSLDLEFDPGADNPVRAFGVQPDGGILVAGEFTTLAGQPRQRIARLDAEGFLDPEFHPSVDDSIYALALQSDGGILLGGRFTLLAGKAHARMGRLNPDGSVDDGFSAGVESNGAYTPSVRTFAVQPDGRIAVAGYFAKLNGESVASIGRLNPNGSLDGSFAAAAGSIVECLALQPDGRILVGGAFTSLDGVSIGSHLGRLNVDGTLDTSFQPLIDMNVLTLALQTDGNILVGGAFNDLGTLRSRIVRLRSDGSLDPAVDPRADRDVYALALQSDGRILAGGWFGLVADMQRSGLCRLNNTTPAEESLFLDDSVFWTRGGGAPEISRATFEHTKNGATWTSLGDGVRISGGWVVTPPVPLSGGNIRARGYLSGAQNNASGWFVEKQWGVPLILEQPLSSVSEWATTVSFAAEVIGSDPLSYQWYRDGMPLEDTGTSTGSQTPVLTLRDLTGRDSGEYTLVASNDLGEATSNAAVLTVQDPWIVLQPLSQALKPGSRVDLEAYAVGSGPLTYQWWKDGALIPGATEPWLQLTTLTADNAGEYWVVVTGAYDSSRSETATIEMVRTPRIVTQPSSQIGERDGEVTFTVEAWGESPLSYEWYFNGELLSDGGKVSGSQTAALILSSLTPDDVGNYSVRVANALGSELSDSAQLAVNSATVEPLFAPDTFGSVFALAVQPDGRILVGGAFSRLGGVDRSCIGRLNPDGSVDPLYNPGADGAVQVIAIQPDGGVVVGGQFRNLGGQPRDRIGRLNPDGSLDVNFNPGASGSVDALALQPDGKILVGGVFSTLDGGRRYGLGRLTQDGVRDSFAPEIYSYIYALALQPDGKILVGGQFTTVNRETHPRLVRLSPNSLVDSSFAPGVDPNNSHAVYALLVQPDGRILVGGEFSLLEGNGHTNLVRLNADGTLDTSFNVPADDSVYSLALQADGSILVTGLFDTLGGVRRDGIARLHPDGSLDPDFCPTASGTTFHGVALQEDGRVLVGGGFTKLGGADQPYIGRLNNPVEASATLTREASRITWQRGGSSPEVWRTTFEHSVDGVNWTLLGDGSRIEAGWELSSEAIPEEGHLRARGFVTSGDANGSAWMAETYLGSPVFVTQPVSQTNDFGTTVSLFAAAVGTPPIDYQWLFNGEPIVEGERISGVNSSQLTLENVSGADAGDYSVTVSNAQGSLSSEFASLHVNEPLIKSPPISQTWGYGQSVRFEVGAVGTDPLSYQWVKDGTELDGATGSALELFNLQESDAGEYRVIVSTDYGSVLSDPATLALVSPPQITTQPAHQAVDRGGNVTLEVAAVGVEPLEYHWWKDGAELVGANGPILELVDAQLSDSGWYQVVVSNAHAEQASNLASLSVNAALWDGAFIPELEFTNVPRLSALAIQPDENILLGGLSLNVGPDDFQRLCRFRPDGTLDADFLPEPNGTVTCLAVLPDGKLLVGGSFTSVAGATRNYLARLYPSGRLDRPFDAQVAAAGSSNPYVCTLALQPDGKVVVGGDFRMVGGVPRLNLARLQSDGTLDAGFVADANQPVRALALQPDGRILVGGQFTVLAGEPRAYLARLNPDGSLDEDFNPAPGVSVLVLAMQADARILVGGSFRTMGEESREWFARLHPDGTLDATFTPSITPLSLRSLSVQADGRIIVAGASTLNGVPCRSLGRLNQDGSLDFSFHPESSWRSAGAALQSDGAVLFLADIIGGWSPYVPPAGFGRLNNTDPATQSLEHDGSTITWLRGGTSPEVWRVTFEYSSDDVAWTLLATPSRIPGGWELTDVALPSEGTLRARGYMTGGQYNASDWFVEARLSLAQPLMPQILVGDRSPRFTEAGFGFDVTGTPGATVLIEVSLDLMEWAEVETLTLGNEPTSINDPAAGVAGHRFYRVRQVP
ncbi:MAG: immunoglobulin domain-containing protein [Verrucomicrobiales bacterium]|nr:immunoglobulin domain-containing protein [Verrucomicrobiales bacterium]